LETSWPVQPAGRKHARPRAIVLEHNGNPHFLQLPASGIDEARVSGIASFFSENPDKNGARQLLELTRPIRNASSRYCLWKYPDHCNRGAAPG
jgi:hypothetical protein